MSAPTHSLLLRIYIGQLQGTKGIPLFEDILWRAKKAKLARASVFKGEMGFGHVGTIQSKKSSRDNDVPILIEILDAPEKIRKFIPAITKAMGNHGLVTVSEVEVVHQPLPSKKPVNYILKTRS